MDLQLTGRVAFVAGSSRGIGRAIAHAFLREGARVVVSGRNRGVLAETLTQLTADFDPDSVFAYCGDLTQPSDIAAAVDATRVKWGGIDCLVANIGDGTAKSGWNLTQSDWDSSFEVNFRGATRLSEAVLPMMIESGRGSIIFTSSIVGLESVSAPLTYSAAKAALVSYSKNLARQVGRKNVRVNCVAPGNILFPGGSWEAKVTKDPERFQRYIEDEVPLRRFGTPEEIANTVAFLASECSAFTTGACVVIDGGQTRGI